MNAILKNRNSARELISAKRERQTRLVLSKEGSHHFAAQPTVNITASEGIHFYAKINLRLDLEAADDSKSIQRYLQVVSEFAEVADALTEESNAELLEVQGETIHLYMPCSPDSQALEQVLIYAIALHDEIEERVKPLAGDSWRRVRYAFDFGPSILIDPETNADDSIVSLSPAANRPAKEFRLKVEEFPKDSIRFPRDILQWSPDALAHYKRNHPGGPTEWVNVDMATVKSFAVQSQSMLTEVYSLQSQLRAHIDSKQASTNFSGLVLNRAIDPSKSTISHPTSIRGWSMRADLDGFSQGVMNAFGSANPLEACRTLTTEFLDIMEDATAFDNQCPWSFVKLPWAGDCASRIIESGPGSYDADGKERPANIALRWHNLASHKRWLVSIAGGDTEEGNGRILVATIKVGWRSFCITGGWAIKRSKQGEQDVGGEPQETVMHSRDVRKLDDSLAAAFKPITGVSDFKRARLRDLAEAGKKQERVHLSQTIPVNTPLIIRPRPYYDC